MLNEIPEPWHSFLAEIDGFLQEETKFHCIGGFVIAMLYGLNRETSDLDVIRVIPRDLDGSLYKLSGKGSFLHAKYHLYLDPVTVATTPDNYEDRVIELFPGQFTHLKLYAVDPYDLALSKLERNSPKDQEDVLRLAQSVPFDLGIFRERYEEEFRVYVEDNIRHRSTINFWIEMIEETREINP